MTQLVELDVADVDTQRGQPARMVFLVQLLEDRQRRQARLLPGHPEVDHDHLAPIIRNRALPPVAPARDAQLRRGLSRAQWSNRLRRAESRLVENLGATGKSHAIDARVGSS